MIINRYMLLSLFQYNIISFILLLPLFLNLFIWEQQIIAWIFGGIFVFFHSFLWGQSIASKKREFFQFLTGLLLFITLLLVLGTIVYLLVNLSLTGIAITLLMIPLAGTLILKYHGLPKQKSLELGYSVKFLLQNRKAELILLAIYAAVAAWIYALIIGLATSEAITSPWDVLPSFFWVLLFVSTLICLLLARKSYSAFIRYLVTAHHLFLVTTLAVFLYKIGYGFDPFLHQAAERAISESGSITPKTPYYLGQYALVVLLHKLLAIPLVWLDRLLLPVLFAVFIPLTLQIIAPENEPASEKYFTSRRAWLSFLFLVIPFSSFIVTTPQGLADFYFLLIILFLLGSLIYKQLILPYWTLFLLAFASLLIHPLAGIPAFILLFLALFEQIQSKIIFSSGLRKLFLFFFFIAGSTATSVLFLLNSLVSPNFSTRVKTLSEVSFSDLLTWFPVRAFLTEMQFRSFFYEFAYFLQQNIWWILTLVLLLTVYWLMLRSQYALLRIFGVTGAILIGNAVFLSSFIQFPELIQYETQDYAFRLFTMAYWVLAPLLMVAAVWTEKKLRQQKNGTEWIFLLFLTAGITSSIFASYPRNNRYELGRQYSVSEADLVAVKKIGEKKTNFVVLANQSVSAAAIFQYGFKTYYPVDGRQVFYYPVPTSGPLYQLYLKMVYDAPTREHAQEAADLVNVDTVYFVLNNYWDNASSLAEQAKLTADSWIEIDNGKVLLFTYEF